MKFPSPFRLPKYQRFEIKPRYYDPIKEELELRKRRIKRAVESGEDEYVPSNIRFERKTHASESSTALIRLGIAAFLGCLVMGWLFYGNLALYAGAGVLTFYIFIRLRRI